MRVARIDRGTFRQPTVTSQGYLKCDAYATRAGVFTYRKPDGTVIRELRPAEDVFQADSLRSLAEVPVTDDHPPDMLTAANTKQYQIGFTSKDVQQENEFVKVEVTITDATAREKILTHGKRETSCGYHCDLEETPGIWEGQTYDAIQRNITYNHLAVVDIGRAGPEVRLRLDAQDAVMWDGTTRADAHVPHQSTNPPKEEPHMVRITLDGITYDVAEAVGQAVMAALNAKDACLTTAQDEYEQLKKSQEMLQGKYDALVAEAKQKNETLDQLRNAKPSRADALKVAKERLALEATATAILGTAADPARIDALDDLAIKKMVLATRFPNTDFDDKSEEYIEGAFQYVATDYAATDAVQLEHTLRSTVRGTNEKKDAASVRQRKTEESKHLWQPLTP